MSLLSDRIVRALSNAPYAQLVVRPESNRATFLPEIASLHTRKELMALPGLGRVAVGQLEAWLAQHGRRLRNPEESIDAVICNFALRPGSVPGRQERRGDHIFRHVSGRR